jgi:hypothetical protein
MRGSVYRQVRPHEEHGVGRNFGNDCVDQTKVLWKNKKIPVWKSYPVEMRRRKHPMLT